ncbi:hypothetical protein BD408DRAFT_413075 [Parasitella parasitica]|nr:hypothetical protein BD408DRAFT_413075 [Parasitella parasitica]
MKNSTAYASKKMQYAELRNGLDKLDQNMKKMDENMRKTVEQMPSIRKLGTLHSSLYMSAGSVLKSNENENASQP